ncbi:neuraminidase-like domain-containing protein [Yinghuangia seranimata]|uniref:Tc toxin subunit A-related protein n=1 Tax=Yinghuangia seranimata TaxID=408067 RepID=UPI00248D0DA0|nr:neuraminidase-like domain-containing protein [Yinghuangia seranimata]MDI2127061.1 hypothetical protein [Yinghuangia seranimata]
MTQFFFNLLSPTAGATVSRTVTVTLAGGDLNPGHGFPNYKLTGATVRFGANGPVVRATSAGGNSWRATGQLPAGTTGGAAVLITATGEAIETTNGGTPTEPEPVDRPFTVDRQVQVVTEATFPLLAIDPFAQDVTPSELPYKLALTGTASDADSGVAGVQVAVDGGAPVAARNLSGDWGRWAIDLSFAVGNHTIRVTATDTLGNAATVATTITVKAPVEPTPVEQAFAATSYLRETLGMASRYLRVDGATTGPTTPGLAALLRQPLDRVVKPASFDAVTADTAQARLAVEVLRAGLTPPAPTALDQRFRAQAYEEVLRRLGTSSDELRSARTADAAARAELAARLGIGLGTPRPDRLDALTFAPDTVTDAQLEQVFGYRSTNPADPLAAPLPAQVALWQQDALKAAWAQADAAGRDGVGGQLPLIDPDLVDVSHVRSTAPTDPARALWTQRRDWIQARVTETAALFTGAGRTDAGFDAALRNAGITVDLLAVAARDHDGVDVTAEVAALGLDLAAFRFLARLRPLVATSSVTESEWQDVVSIAVQARKRGQFGAWRLAERQAGILALDPAVFTADPGLDPVAFTGALRWRATRAARDRWERAVAARQRQSDAAAAGYAAAVAAVEQTVLPDLRDALVTETGARANPPRSMEQTAEQLSRDLSIDLRAAAGTRTTRVGQAVDSLQNLLVSARTGRLVTQGAAHTVTVSDEAGFDAEWAWLETYARWSAAMQAFAYPENRLLPSLFVHEFVASDRELAPSKPFTDLMFGTSHSTGLVGVSRFTPADANAFADAYLAQMKADPGMADAMKRVPLAAIRPGVKSDDYRALCASLAADWLGHAPVEEREMPQHLREIFWLVPVALARKLHDSGHYADALDWYHLVLAFRLPPGRRFVYQGLALEQNLTSTFGRLPEWLPLVKELNPHFTARHRKGAYTRYTLMSVVECFLAFADSEFARNAPDSNARARALYQSATDLLALPELTPETGPSVPFPVNPVWRNLGVRAAAGLAKIHAGLNVAGQGVVASGGESVLPSVYRYSVVAERAKTLVTIAQQVESAYLSALEHADGATYDLLQSGHDLRTARAALSTQELRVEAAGNAVEQAGQQRDRAALQFDTYDGWIEGGLNDDERAAMDLMKVSAPLHVAAGFAHLADVDPLHEGTAAAGALAEEAAAASTAAQLKQTRAGFERRAQEWRFQRALAGQDRQIAETSVAGAKIQQQIAVRERDSAFEQLDHANTVADFLATKFTNAHLYEWMSGVLGNVYSYFLQQATAIAQLAQAQLAFERQEPLAGFIAADYWQPAAAQNDTAVGQAPTDRRGITGSARLLQDLFQLDQHAFATDRRKLHLTRTFALSQLAAYEMQQFRQTGVLTFATPQELFDRDFPGHYLRLVHRVELSLFAVVPPPGGVSGTLSASGVSRTVVARDSFDTVMLRRDPESIAVTAPLNAAGAFKLEPDSNMLLPFEGMGVDTVWQLELPKAANPFDYDTIAEVLFTVEYTALDSPDYRHTVVRSLNPGFSGDRTFSLRDEFPDVWYDLVNPDTVADPARRMHAVLPLDRSDFPPHVSDLAVAHVTLFAVRDAAFTDELTVSALRHTPPGGTATDAAAVRTVNGVAGTRRPNGTAWQPLVGGDPAGTWDLRFEDTAAVRAAFADGRVQDVALVFTVTGTQPEWPS